MTAPLSQSEIASHLPALPAWQVGHDAITRTFEFPDFVRAFAFITEVAFAAERANHHPDWRNVYRTVTVSLSSHDAGGLTERDFALALAIDAIAHRHIPDMP